MKKIAFIILCSITSASALGQNLDTLLQNAMENQDFHKTFEYAEQALEKQEKLFGVTNKKTANLLNILGTCYFQFENYQKAIEYTQKSLEIEHAISAEENATHTVLCYNIGYFYAKLNNYQKAIKYTQTALKIHLKLVEETHEDIVQLYNALEEYYNQLGNYQKAIEYAEKALKITIEISGEKNTEVGNFLSNLGIYYARLGIYQKAIEYAEKALEVTIVLYGESTPNVATSINNLGTYYAELGNYQKAIEYGEKALKMRFEIFEEINPSIANSYNNLGNYYSSLGNYQQAIEYTDIALEIQIELLEETHPEIANSLDNLGNYHANLGDYQKAIEYGEKALKIRQKKYGDKHPVLAISYNNLGTHYAAIGEYKKAKEYGEAALKIEIEQFGEKNLTIASSFNNLGTYYADLREFEIALQYTHKGLDIQLEELGDIHLNIVKSYNNLGSTYSGWKKGRKANLMWIKSMDITTKLVEQQFNYLTEQERGIYWNSISYTITSSIPSYTHQFYKKQTESSSLAYNSILLSKGLLLNTDQQIRNAIANSGDTVLIDAWENLSLLKQQLINQQNKPLSEQSGVQELEAQALEFEKIVTQRSSEFRKLKNNYVKWEEVRSKLKPKEVAIEFISFEYYNYETRSFTDSVMYAALLLRKESKYPIYIPLFEEQDLLELVNTKPDIVYLENGLAIYEKLWAPLTKHIKTGEIVYFAASGLLHQLNIAALPMDEDHILGDQYNLVRLSSTRELVSPKEKINNTSAVLYGGIEYSIDQSQMQAESRKYNSIDLLATRSLADDSIRAGVKYLPGTKREVESISQCLEQKQIKVTTLTAINANEESFKALSGQKNGILHIATHGFFWDNTEAKDKQLFKQRVSNDQQPQHVGINPLSRSGLLLAGANLVYTGNRDSLPDGVQDGVLTAEEISLLDLSGTDLVVLSACETGNGEVTSEGVFGLQRAFKQVGVQTLIMSLWKVNDEATQIMMTQFYNYWLSGQSKREAFTNAQNKVRENYNSPYYWAAFIMLD